MKKEIPRMDEISEFCKKYDLHFNDAKVNEVRHIVPLMLMEAYSNIYGQCARKIKGIWEKKPEDWPVHVPFVDPNNKPKQSNGSNSGDSNSKPSKEVCMKMLTYLHGMLLNQGKVCQTPAAQQKALTSQASTMMDIRPTSGPDHRVQVPLPAPVSDFSRPSGVLSTDLSRAAEAYPSMAAGTVQCEAGENDDETLRDMKYLYESDNFFDDIINGTHDNLINEETLRMDSYDKTNLGITSPLWQDDLSTTVDLGAINTSATTDPALCSKLQTDQTSNCFVTAMQPTQVQTYQSINNALKLDQGLQYPIQTLDNTNDFDVDLASRDSFISCDQEKAPMQIDMCSAADDEVLPQTVIDYSGVSDMMYKLMTYINLNDSQVNALNPEDKQHLPRLLEMFLEIYPAVELRLKQIQHLMGNSLAQGTVCSYGSDFSMEYSRNLDYPRPIQSSSRHNSAADATSILPMNVITSSKRNISNCCGVANPMQTGKVIAATSTEQMHIISKTLGQEKSITGKEKLIARQSMDPADLNIKRRDGVNANTNDAVRSVETPVNPSLNSNLSESDFKSDMMCAEMKLELQKLAAQLEQSVVALEEDDQHIKASGIGSGDSQTALGSHGSGEDSDYLSGELDSLMTPTSESFHSVFNCGLTANQDVNLHGTSFGQDDFFDPSMCQLQSLLPAQAAQYNSEMNLSKSSDFASSYMSMTSAGNLKNAMSQTEKLLTGSVSVSATDDGTWSPGLEANRVVEQSLASQQNTSPPNVIAINPNVASGNKIMWANLDLRLHTPSGNLSDVLASGAVARSSSSRVEYSGNKGVNGIQHLQSHAVDSFSKSNHMIGSSAGTFFHFTGSSSKRGMMSTASNQSFNTPSSSMSGNFLIEQSQQILLQSNNVVDGGKGRVLPPTTISLGVYEPKDPTPVDKVASSTLIPGLGGCKVGDKRRNMDVQESEQKEAVNTHNTVVIFGRAPVYGENFDFEDYDVQLSKRQRK